MIDIFGMPLEVISRPFNIEMLKLYKFVAFYLLLDMVPFMQKLFEIDAWKILILISHQLF